MVQGQRQVISFKSKKRRVTDPDEWIIVENTHEAIITRELWNQAQKMRKTREHFHTPKVEREVSIFAGLVRCADCGSTMAGSLRGNEGKQKLTYRCGRYANHGKEICSSHNIREEVLVDIALNDIRNYAKISENDKQAFTNQVIRALKETTVIESNVAERQLVTAEHKVVEINSIVKNLYKEKLSGKMPETFFYSLLADYEKELKELEEKIPALREQVKAEVGQEDNVNHWANNISKYLKVEKLDRFMARELIDTITVSEFYKVDGKNVQDVTINYKFVGNLGELFAKRKEVA